MRKQPNVPKSKSINCYLEIMVFHHLFTALSSFDPSRLISGHFRLQILQSSYAAKACTKSLANACQFFISNLILNITTSC